MVRNKRSTLSPAGQLFVKLLSHRPRLAFPSDAARAIWEMIAASEDPEAQAFKYHTTMVIDRVQGADEAAALATVNRYYEQWLTPALVDAAVTELASRGELPGPLTARLHQRVAQWSTAEGRWKW
jgi:hypothetical protein